MITKTCEICGKEFKVKPYRKDKARFCSFQCGGKWHAKTRITGKPRPDMIGNKLRSGLRPANAFTSEQKAGKRLVDYVVKTCENCGKTFEVPPWLDRQNPSRYCSLECKHIHCRGDNDPRYVGGPKTYRGKGWLEARAKAVARDNGTCQHCGKHVGQSIPVHHIRPFREFADIQTANALDNLICLCQSCHMKEEPPLAR